MSTNFSFVSRLHSLLLFFLLALTCEQLPAQQSDSAAYSRDIDSHIQKIMRENWIPGAAVVVVKGDKTILLEGYGLADVEENRKVTSDTLFYIASSTKSFTGLAAAICDQRGELDLDETLDRSLPDAHFHQDIDPSKITLRDLLTHTHGINNNGPVSFRSAYSGQHTPAILKDLMKHHGVSRNGRDFEYGNIGYNIAGLALQNKLNLHWKDLVRDEIFKPLGMKSTTGRVSQSNANALAMPHGVSPIGFSKLHYAKSDENMHAAGGLVTTASDLSRWLKANINRGELDGNQVIPASVFEAALNPIAKQSGSYMSFKRDGYGLGWNTGEYDGDQMIHHFGGFSGFHCHISFMPEKKIGVAILVNSGSGALFADVVSRFAYDRLREVPDLAQRFTDERLETMTSRVEKRRLDIGADLKRRASRPQKLPHPLESYTGTFENEWYGQIVLAVVDGKLEAAMGPLWSSVETFKAERNALRVELTGRGEVVQVHFDGNKQAQRIVLAGDTYSRTVQ